MQQLETPRLILRQWRESDMDDLFEYASTPEVGPAAGWRPHLTPQQSLVIIQEVFIKGDDSWAICLKNIGKVIGSVGLHKDALRPGINARMLGYALSPRYWGHGLATEAAREMLRYGFGDMALDLISVRHFPWNTASSRVIEKCGFRYEGTLRRAMVRYDGQGTEDAVCYSMTWDEYDAIRLTY